MSKRGYDGKFASETPPEICSYEEAWMAYNSYLAAVCTHQGLNMRQVGRQLKRPGRAIPEDRDWLAAAYARQLAIYLTNITLNIPQNWLADAAGLTPGAVCKSLKVIEDLRDNGNYDVRIDLIGAELAAHNCVNYWGDRLSERAQGRIDQRAV